MKIPSLFVVLLLPLALQAQMLPDTVAIPQVEVHSKIHVAGAGVERRPVDSLVMMREAETSLSDLLAAHTSVFVKSEGRGALATVSFRGTDASHTQVYWNGMSIQSPMLGQVDFSQIPVFLMDKITLLPGASSVTDGSGGLGGSIDLVSRPDWTQRLYLSGMAGFGSYLTFNNYLGVKAGNSHFQSSTKLYYNRSKNDFPFYNKNVADIDPQTGQYIYPLQRNEHADYLLDGLLQEFAFRLHKNYLLQMNYWFQNSDRSLPRLNTYEGDDHANLSRQKQKTHRAVLHLSHFGKKGRLDVNLGLQVENMTYQVQNRIGGRGYFDAVYSDSKTWQSSNKLQYSYQLTKKTLLKASYRFQYDHVQTYDSVRRTGYDRYRRWHALAVSWQQYIGNRFSTMVLLRKEWIDRSALSLIPYFGFDWDMGKQKIWVLHGNVTRNFRYPSLNDLYWQPGGNPELKPEKGWSSELGIRWQPKINNVSLKAEMNGFYNNIFHWILWTPSPFGYWSPENVQRVVSRGFELHVSLNFSLGVLRFLLRGGYAFTKSTNEGDAGKWGDAAVGKQIPYVPVHSGNFTGEVQWKDFFLTWVNTSYSERFTTSSNDLTLRDKLYPYFMNDLYAGKDFALKKGTLGLQLKVYNLFNEEYRSVLGRPMPGRNYLLMLTFRY
jgi:outer membrane receptor protein involved in Fe transport